MNPGSERKRRWLRVLVVIGLLGLIGLGVAGLMFSSWSELHTLTRDEAWEKLDAAVLEAGGGGAYLHMSPTGSASVDRTMEGESEHDLDALHFAAWHASNQTYLRMDVPWWFVRMKMTDAVNLGTFVAFLAKDWSNLDLSVTEDDLERRGPGLVFDGRFAQDSRFVIWVD